MQFSNIFFLGFYFKLLSKILKTAHDLQAAVKRLRLNVQHFIIE